MLDEAFQMHFIVKFVDSWFMLIQLNHATSVE